MQTGVQGNAWNAAQTGAGGFGPVKGVQLNNCRVVTIFGHVSGACTLTVEFSADGSTWYDSGVTNVPAGAADIGFSFDCAAPYVRLKSSADVLATITITGS